MSAIQTHMNVEFYEHKIQQEREKKRQFQTLVMKEEREHTSETSTFVHTQTRPKRLKHSNYTIAITFRFVSLVYRLFRFTTLMYTYTLHHTIRTFCLYLRLAGCMRVCVHTTSTLIKFTHTQTQTDREILRPACCKCKQIYIVRYSCVFAC